MFYIVQIVDIRWFIIGFNFNIGPVAISYAANMLELSFFINQHLSHVIYYIRLLIAESQKEWPYPQVPCLDVFIDIAPKIFDKPGILTANNLLDQCCFKEYETKGVRNTLQQYVLFQSYYQSIPENVLLKQTDLRANFNQSVPGVDFGWTTYIWNEFELIKRETVNNRVHLTKLSSPNG